MAVSAVVKDGKLVESASENSVKKAAAKNGMDKEAFLQLLVAQMKYQDPLEPTSNTEYISQYATFSQVEQMQNMAATMELTRASSMVGKMVEVQSKDANGDVTAVQGVVEYVTYENNKAFVSIDGNLYSADDVHAVIDEAYQTAFEIAAAFIKALDALPSVNNLTIKDKDAVEALQEGFNSMTAYQQGYISDEYIKKLQKYVQRMAEIVAVYEEGNGETNKTPDDDTAGDGDKTEETDGDNTAGGESGSGTEGSGA